MLTKNDRRALELLERHPFVAMYGIAIVPLFFAASAMLHLFAASTFAANVEMGLIDVIAAWYSGGHGEYGTFGSLAVLRVERAFSATTNCLLSGGLAYGFVISHRRQQRLVAALKEAGRW